MPSSGKKSKPKSVTLTRNSCQMTRYFSGYRVRLRFWLYISLRICKYSGSVSTVVQMWCAIASLCLCFSLGTRRCSPCENQWLTVVREQSQIKASSSRDTFQCLRNSSSSISCSPRGWKYVLNASQCPWAGDFGAILIAKRLVMVTRYRVMISSSVKSISAAMPC
jgi:hypothetical protein